MKVDDDTGRWVVEVRRRLHRHPELANEEVRTQRTIVELLEGMGLEPRKVAGTGVVATIEGARPGPTVALRADMDALGIQEEGTGRNADYMSEVDGVMHACGHDGHMAMALGAARVLARSAEELPGRVVLLFQPAEERSPGGALRMIAGGALDGVDAVLGFHIMGYLDFGVIALRPGPFMAKVQWFELELRGRGGHHMDPDACVDPIAMAARFATTVERDVAHALAPGSSFILALGTVHGGSAFNQTPDTVRASGTLRTYSEEDSRAAERVMRANLDGIVEAVSKGDLRASYELVVDPGYPVVVNDPAMARRAAGVLGEALGGVDPESRLNFGGEDFAYYLERAPGLFIFLGTRNPDKGITEVNHSSRFDIDEDVLSLGVEAYLVLVSDMLADPSAYGIG